MTASTATLRERVRCEIEAAEIHWRSQEDGGLSLQVLLGLIENRMVALLADADAAPMECEFVTASPDPVWCVVHRRIVQDCLFAVEVRLRAAEERAEKAERKSASLGFWVGGAFAGWTPTAENINALPEPIRRYVHGLEARCDPAGDVRTIAVQRDNIDALVARLRAAEERARTWEVHAKAVEKNLAMHARELTALQARERELAAALLRLLPDNSADDEPGPEQMARAALTRAPQGGKPKTRAWRALALDILKRDASAPHPETAGEQG